VGDSGKSDDFLQTARVHQKVDNSPTFLAGAAEDGDTPPTADGNTRYAAQATNAGARADTGNVLPLTGGSANADNKALGSRGEAHRHRPKGRASGE